MLRQFMLLIQKKQNWCEIILLKSKKKKEKKTILCEIFNVHHQWCSTRTGQIGCSTRKRKKSKKKLFKQEKKSFFVCVSSEEDIKTLMITIFKDDILQQHQTCNVVGMDSPTRWRDKKTLKKKMLTPRSSAVL